MRLKTGMINKKTITLLIISIIITILVFKNNRKNIVELNYFTTGIGHHESFDPLEGDKAVNLSVMRMLYATPIEINRDSTLVSNVLDHFDYDSKLKIITFKVKSHMTYSDGTSLSVKDVALAISRMSYFRPTFPVIKDILGVKEWAQKKDGLETFPSGISINEQEIKIQLTKPHLNPLFRFCLELFSIIPERCIDLKTGKMKCDQAPSSGYYTITNLTKEKIEFQKRMDLVDVAEVVPYNKIIFIYKSLKDACSEKIEANSIISASEIDFLKSNCDSKIPTNQIHWTPASRFSGVLFNPEALPFNIKENRQFFAEKIREQIKLKYPNLIVEKSIFSALLPGYLAPEKFNMQHDSSAVAQRFKGKKIAIVENLTATVISIAAIEEVAKSLSMDIVYIDAPTIELRDKAFLSGKLQTNPFGSGFWAQDPVGDISMLFTSNLHAPLSFNWQDQELYKHLESIENETNPQLLKSKMEKLNLHLYDQSLIAPLVHFRRLFIAGDSFKSLNLPQSITSPAPWQLISAD